MIDSAVIHGFLVSLCMGLSALAFFVWAVLSNQMDDTEDVKYRVLDRELEEQQVRKIDAERVPQGPPHRRGLGAMDERKPS